MFNVKKNPGKEEDWLGARNFCRQRCMDSVSVETSPENEWVKQRIVDGKVSYKDYWPHSRRVGGGENLTRILTIELNHGTFLFWFLCELSMRPIP